MMGYLFIGIAAAGAAASLDVAIAADVAQFTPFLMPMLRKVYPALIANELVSYLMS